MNLQSLKTSITNMPRASALQVVCDIRKSRRTAKKKPPSRETVDAAVEMLREMGL